MKDLAQLAREAAYRAHSEGQSINGIAEAVMQVVCDTLNPPACAATDAENYGCELASGHAGPHEALRGLTSFRQWETDQPNSGGALAGEGSSTT